MERKGKRKLKQYDIPVYKIHSITTMGKRIRYRQLKSYAGYLEWDQETKDLALEKLLTDYITAAGPFMDATLFVADLAETLQDDILHFEIEEEFEICQMLKDLYNEIC